MKTLFTLFCTLMVYNLCYSQSISPTLISNGGSVSFSNEIKVDWSIGEIAVSNHANNINLSEGFHQGDELATSLYSFEIENTLSFFPNPNPGIVNFKGKVDELISIDIHNAVGAKIKSISVLGSSFQIDDLNSGLYLFHCNP